MVLAENPEADFLAIEFAKLYSDLSLCYQGMGELDFAQDYLAQAIQCVENTPGRDQELVELYLSLAELLRQ